jgi:hypothetical protein
MYGSGNPASRRAARSAIRCGFTRSSSSGVRATCSAAAAVAAACGFVSRSSAFANSFSASFRNSASASRSLPAGDSFFTRSARSFTPSTGITTAFTGNCRAVNVAPATDSSAPPKSSRNTKICCAPAIVDGCIHTAARRARRSYPAIRTRTSP